MASVMVIPQSTGSARARSVTSSGSVTSFDSDTSTSSESGSGAPVPGQSSFIDLPKALSHEASQFDVLNMKDSRTLEARDLRYEVTERGSGFFQKLMKFENPCKAKDGSDQKKTILREINFQTQSGQMLAILGSSGSGKTTLLDVIACQTFTGDITGEVLLDGRPRTPDNIKACSAYVRQDDRLLPHLTVKETLNFVAQLKLPPSWSKEKRDGRVNAVIAELGLRHVANGKVGGEEIRGISGGERRRVSIGIQLLLDPSVLFLDEPTSGLDSFTAHNLVETLAKLARNNRIVVMTIHQPRSDIFELFDVMMLLSQGQMVYFGQQNELVNYFTRMGYPCPELTNPCDYYVDLATVDHKTEETEEETGIRVNRLIDLYRRRETLTDDDLHPDGRPPSYSISNTPQNTSRIKRDLEAKDLPLKYSAEGNVEDIVLSIGQSVTFDNSSGKDAHIASSTSSDGLKETIDDPDLDPEDIKEVLATKRRLSSQTFLAQKQSEASLMTYVNKGFEPDAVTEKSDASNWQLKASTKFDIWSEQRKVFRDPSLVVGVDADVEVRTFRNSSYSSSGKGYPVAVDMIADQDDRIVSGANTIRFEQGEKIGFFLQFWVLVRRTLRNNLEDYGFLLVQAIEALFMSIIIGVIYLDLGLDQTGARDRFGLLYVLAALYPYMVILDVMGKYYKERFILYYEMLDDLYSAGPYFFAKVVGDLPEHTVFIIFYCVPVYFLSGLQMDAALFFQTFAILYILVMCSRALALWAGSLFTAYPVSVVFAQSLFSMFLLSSGFIFNLDNLFVGMQWVSFISYLKWGYQGMCTTEFVGLNFTCTTPVPEACIQDGEDALESYSLDGGAVWQSSLVIVAEIIVFLGLFFVSVKFKSQKPHQQ